MKKTLILSRLIIIRSQILPKQLIAFDQYESYSFEEYAQNFSENANDYYDKCMLFINQLRRWNNLAIDYTEKSHQILLFTKALPFFDSSILENFEEYNPFDDFPATDLDHIKEHIIPKIETSNGQYEIGISWNDDIKNQIDWFNSIKKRTFLDFCRNYLDLLKEIC